MLRNIIDRKECLLGKKFGTFEVIDTAERIDGWNVNRWTAKCQCGSIRKYSTTQMKQATSCGCLRKARMSKLRKPVNEVKRTKLMNALYSQISVGATKRSLEFSLSRDFVIKNHNNNCYYCNSPPSNKLRTGGYVLEYNGFDRVDNNIGYTESNCVSCCKFCNSGKKDMSAKDFIYYVKNLYENLRNTPLFKELMGNQQDYAKYYFNVDSIDELMPDEG